MANAQWAVRFFVKFADGSESSECVYLASADLRNAREAKRRAVSKARQRLERKLMKWKPVNKMFATSVDCVG